MIFTHGLRYPTRKKTPLVEKGWTQETVDPWRKGVSIVFRIPFTTLAVSVGRWVSKGSETDFHDAIGTRIVEDIPAREIRTW